MLITITVFIAVFTFISIRHDKKALWIQPNFFLFCFLSVPLIAHLRLQPRFNLAWMHLQLYECGREKMCSFRGSTKRSDKHILNEFRQSSTDMEMLDHTIRITPCKLNGHHSIRQTSCIETHRQRIPNTTQMKVTKMLLVISTVFVILNLPSYVIRVWIFIVSVSKCVHTRLMITLVIFSIFFSLTHFWNAHLLTEFQ